MARTGGSGKQGPIGERVADTVAALRREAGLSQSEFGERLASVGRPMQFDTVSRLESGRRAVTVDDLLALAAALDVSPLLLLLPPEDDGQPVRLTEGRAAGFGAAWRWGRGEEPLPGPRKRQTSEAEIAADTQRALAFYRTHHPEVAAEHQLSDDQIALGWLRAQRPEMRLLRDRLNTLLNDEEGDDGAGR